MTKMLYAIMTHHCNLSCPHCTIKDADEQYDHNLFMNQLNHFDGIIILFGGEPTTEYDRMMGILRDIDDISRISSVSTNLLILNDELLDIYKKIHYVATSWNLTRFTDNQYTLWRQNISKLASVGVKPGILITITDDLIKYPIESFMNVINSWNSNEISWIQFEHVIDEHNSKEYYQRADEWLMNVYKAWTSRIYVKTFDSSLTWYHDCKDVYTLEPDGFMHNCCPNGLYNQRWICNDCMTCDHASTCMPCRLHQYCSYPKGLFELIKHHERG